MAGRKLPTGSGASVARAKNARARCDQHASGSQALTTQPAKTNPQIYRGTDAAAKSKKEQRLCTVCSLAATVQAKKTRQV